MAEAKGISYEAQVEAREALKKLQAQAVAADLEVKSLETAIAEAHRRLDAALAAEQDETERAGARMALGLVAGFVARGKILDEKLAAFVDEFRSLRADFHDLEKTGFPPSTWALVENNLKAAVAARLMGTPLKTDFLPPHRRHSFEHVVQAWGDSVRLRAEARLRETIKAAPPVVPPAAPPQEPASKAPPKRVEGGIGEPLRSEVA